MLSFKEMSGYQLSKNIMHHGEQISSGTLVPILKNLEAAELIRFRRSGKRKIYGLTGKGEKYIQSLREIGNEFKKRMFVESVDQNLLYYDILTNYEDVEAIKDLLDRIGDLLLDIIKTGFRLEKSNSKEKVDSLVQEIREVIERNNQ